MKLFLLLCLIALGIAAPIVDDAFLNEINTRASTWRAAHNHLTKQEYSAVKPLLGSIIRPTGFSDLPETTFMTVSLPASFDSAENWPGCVHPIRNQASCGSCWAFGASEALSDRFCIQTGKDIILSPQELVACDPNDFGCQGGYLDKAWEYMSKHGLPTETCEPYTAGGGSEGPCPDSCVDGSDKVLYKAKNVRQIADSELAIMSEVYKNGPVEVAFEVYQDFMAYAGGVYKHTTGGLLGGHAVKLTGWGEEDGQKYWKIANSWGTGWGEEGFFRIARGTNECGIESDVVAGDAVRDTVINTANDAEINQASLIDMINQSGAFQAKAHERFAGMTVKEVKGLMGTRLGHVAGTTAISLHAKNIPDSFDSAKNWPGCIHAVRNQASCGSCWAFGASEALSDRVCIAGGPDVVLSPQALVSCDDGDFGCEGGYLDHAWNYLARTGVPSDECYPYTSGSGSVAPCKENCVDGSEMKLFKAKASTVVSLTDEKSIQTAIMTEGPVEGGFTVYQDFMSYAGGVYKHQYGGVLGGHAIKITGWGVDSETGQKYWTIYNSWGTGWGENGTFRILRGSDECGIESNVVVGSADI